uniref:Reverse transcriptase domain-containing protein n=1 Tax=Megaselia scalaris TaxID=36166 RepID=T1GL28_MEGSC
MHANTEYADDKDVVGKKSSSVASVFQRLEEEASSKGLRVNAYKTKCMLSSRNQSHHESLGPIFTIGDYDFQIVLR